MLVNHQGNLKSTSKPHHHQHLASSSRGSKSTLVNTKSLKAQEGEIKKLAKALDSKHNTIIPKQWLQQSPLQCQAHFERIRVIPCQINTKKYLTSRIWTKLGSDIVPVETFTHSQFQHYMLCGFRVRASQKVNFWPNFGLPLGT